ncbi:hypothetical protein MN116_007293 [Schistosoma mekongi]|uniref:Uncharacterized protein n=1 Tax=Schistosoma mekongi TaxID=38744 RepID=A0AAE1Z8W7_SCHME|nr:hypothetical protein MN116_007293 [Schistosoma mekongi]
MTTSSIETNTTEVPNNITLPTPSQSEIVNHSTSPLPSPTLSSSLSSFETCTSVSTFVSVLDNYLQRQSDNSCQEKVTWLRNIVNILLGILLFMTMILLTVLIILSYFIRQYILLQRENKIR